ncbi:MAG: GTP-binding protein [Persephonella sp.]|nr:MAG: GTP-binding protein [Persephonella sp.]
MANLKIVVGGHFGAGKTTLIKGISHVRPVLTEAKLSGLGDDKEYYPNKTTTTVGAEWGKLSIGNLALHMFGIPGQSRFSFIWDSIGVGTKGYIFLIDSTKPELWEDTMEQIDFFMERHPAPFIIAANKQDLPDAKSLDEIKKAFGDYNVPIILISALKNINTQELIKKLLEEMVKHGKQTK